MTIQKPIFIVGNPHTGTSLLSNIIGSHPDVFMIPGETRFFSELPYLKRKFHNLNDVATRNAFARFIKNLVCTRDLLTLIYGDANLPLDNKIEIDLSEKEIADLLNSEPHITSHAQFFPAVCNVLAKKRGASRWLDKSPEHVYHLTEIIQQVPGALIVETVRDPRDILVSRISRGTHEWQSERGPKSTKLRRWSYGGYHPVWDSLRWRAAVNAAEAASAAHPRRVYQSKYEDLVHDPESHIRKLCEFLELQFDPAMLGVQWRNSTSLRTSQTGIGPQAVGRWHEKLPLDAVAVCQIITKKQMVRMQYSLISIPLQHAPRVFIIFLSAAPQLLQRLYRRFRIGGITRLLATSRILRRAR